MSIGRRQDAPEPNRLSLAHALVVVGVHPDGDGSEKYVLCGSQARGEKEKAMLERQMNRLTEELLKIDTALRKSKRKETDTSAHPPIFWATASHVTADRGHTKQATSFPFLGLLRLGPVLRP